MNSTRCPECGAVYADPGDSCAVRFDALLALNHSRREPWGAATGRRSLPSPCSARRPTCRHLTARAALHRIYVGAEAPDRASETLVARRGAVLSDRIHGAAAGAANRRAVGHEGGPRRLRAGYIP